MNITRTSEASGITRSMDLNVTEEQMALFESRQALIQDIFPDLTPSEREFIKTGIIQEEWENIFKA